MLVVPEDVDGGLVKKVVAEEAGVPPSTLGVEDPQQGPLPGWPESAAADGHLRPLADDVASEADPRSAGELEAETGRLGNGGREAGGEPRRLEDDEERGRPTGEGGQPAQAVRDASGARVRVRAGRQVHQQEIHRAAGEQCPGDCQSLVERCWSEDDEPLRAHATGDCLHRIEAPCQVQPGDDRALGLGLGGKTQG
jgi:hypothetical protein